MLNVKTERVTVGGVDLKPVDPEQLPWCFLFFQDVVFFNRRNIVSVCATLFPYYGY